MSKNKSLEHYYILLRRRIIRPILQNKKLAYFVSKHCLKTYLAMFYENWLGKRLNMRHPRDINELLMQLSVKTQTDPIQHRLRVQCADKYLVREYVKSKGLEDILIPCYGVYDSFDEIDFEKLPNQFVVQTNFGCGHIWICKDKASSNIEKWHKRFDEWMAIRDFGWESGEWQYAEIPHKLVVTKYLDSLGAISVNDYKFHCMHGQVYGCFAAYDRIPGGDHAVQFDHYDINWNLTDGILPSYHPKRRLIPKPQCFGRMIEIASTLSADFPYCRVDLYEVEGKVLFGELTFTPQGNVMCYYTDEALQDMLKFYNHTSC
jgi:hypothetical protein